MATYYVNNKPQYNGDHEVHQSTCVFIPLDKKLLGEYSTCYGAVKEAQKTYPTADGCKTCCPECHNR